MKDQDSIEKESEKSIDEVLKKVQKVHKKKL